MTDQLPNANEPILSPELVKQILEVIDRDELAKLVSGDAEKWIQERGTELIVQFAMPAINWLAKAISRSPELEPLDDQSRMFIWHVANRINEASPSKMSAEQFFGWTFCLISLGYVMRIDHENDRHQSNTNTESV